MRSPADAKGAWVWLRPQFVKQPSRSHHATQNSVPASLAGGRRSRIKGRVPPGRTTMLLKALSGAGLGTRVPGVVRTVSAVSVDTPVRVVATVLAPVETALGARDPPPPLPLRTSM